MQIVTIIATLLAQLSGVATVYRSTQHYGKVLYCDYALPGEQRYALETGVWFALDVRQYTSGLTRCGDKLCAVFADGTVLCGLALDAGRFRERWVSTYGPDVPIVIDIPGLWWPYSDRLSQLVTVYNLSKQGGD